MESQGQNRSLQSSDESIEIDPEILIGGVKVNYYFHCPTQLWLFSHFITFEQESELVLMGRVIERESFKNIRTKNLIIDNLISLDFVRGSDGLVVIDVKKSSKFEEAHYYQVLYYLWYMKNIKKISNVKGIISYPTERRKTEVELTAAKESEMEEILKKIHEVITLPDAPPPSYKPYCKSCAYYEFCWV